MCFSVSVCVSILFILSHISFLSVTGSNHLSVSHYLTQRLRRQSSCTELEFRCSNGNCISSFNKCDGPKDCSDGSDETVAACRVDNIRCPSLAFECAYGACIDKEQKCDGKSDCADGSDEQGCSQQTLSSICGSGKYRCSNGQCIDTYAICDGIKDCSDGGDETRNLCKNFKCPTNSFQCDYGACMDHSVKCNNKADCHDGSDEWNCDHGTTPPTNGITPVIAGSCRLPEHPKHGVYVSSLCQPGDLRAACRNLPGTSVPPNWVLKYSCNANYDLTSNDSEFSICDNGVWKSPLDCIKLCPPLKSLSVDVRCVYEGREVSCDKPMKPNTTATAKCKQHYKQVYKPEYNSLLCHESGDWSYQLFYCTPECGVSSNPETLQTLILNGLPTHQGEYPWLAALYLRNNQTNLWEQKCGGTLISPHIVLTAAHCLVSIEGTVTPQNIKVGLGKYYRDFYKYENYSIIADAREIIVPRYYTGGPSYFALDIGLIDLAVSIQVTAYIMPVCVDWTSSLTITSGTIGHVAGWGTTENKTSSAKVLSAQLSYIDNADCIKRIRLAYKRYLTHDKFCAGSINGSQVDRGDSGGGLTVVKNGQHFVFGVVSTKITEVKSFTLFTDMTNAEHRLWLEQYRTYLDGLHFET